MENKLINILNDDTNQQYYRYLLVNPIINVSNFDYSSVNSMRDHYDEDAMITVIRSDLTHDLSVCPKLVILGKPNQPIEEQLFRHSFRQSEDEVLQSKRYICGWLVSKHSLEELAPKLTNIGIFLNQFIKMKFVPFYEPFRLQLLHQGNGVCPEFIRDLFSGIKQYHYLSTQKKVNTIHALEQKPEAYSVFLSDEAQFYQQQLRTIFALYLAQVNICRNSSDDETTIDVLTIARAYRQGMLYGLTDSKDLTIFTLMSYRYGDLLSHAGIKQAIDKSIADKGSLTQRFQALDQSYFSSLNE